MTCSIALTSGNNEYACAKNVKGNVNVSITSYFFPWGPEAEPIRAEHNDAPVFHNFVGIIPDLVTHPWYYLCPKTKRFPVRQEFVLFITQFSIWGHPQMPPRKVSWLKFGPTLQLWTHTPLFHHLSDAEGSAWGPSLTQRPIFAGVWWLVPTLSLQVTKSQPTNDQEQITFTVAIY